MKQRSIMIILFVLISTAAAWGADAAPKLVNYQGLLTDETGQPITECVDLTFRIYDAATAGSVVWQETHTNVCPVDGRFTVVLGEGDVPTPIDDAVFATAERWLGIAVGVEAELAPRTRMTSMPYSQRVNTVDRASGGAIAGTVEIEVPAVKGEDLYQGGLVVHGSSADFVVISPADNIGFRAAADNGDDLLLFSTANNAGALQVNVSNAVKALTRSVEINPYNSVVLRATEENGDETVSLMSQPSGGSVYVNASDALKSTTRTVAISPADNYVLRSTEQGAEQTVAITSQETGAAVLVSSTDAAKALARTVEISPADNVVLRSIEGGSGDETVAITSGSNGATVLVTGTDVAKGTQRSVQIDPFNNVALRVREQNNDDVLLISADENGAAIEVNTSDASKALTSSVAIRPGDNMALQALGAAGDTLVGISTSNSEGSIVLTTSSKAGSRAVFESGRISFFSAAKGDTTMIITPEGIFFLGGSAKGDTTMIIGADGSIKGKRSISMGLGNVNSENFSNVLGISNSADGDSSAVLGGFLNGALNIAAVVCGGARDTAAGNSSVVVGGSKNVTTARQSFIGGGSENRIEAAQWTVIAGGRNNSIGGTASTISGGWGNRIANGSYCAIPGGYSDTVFGVCSMAFGEHVTTYERRNVTFFEGDSSGSLGINRDWYNGGTDHPIHVGTNTSNGNGAYLSAGGTWTDGSSRTFKDRFQDLDGEELLAKIAALPVQSWYYRNSEERHIGPVAEDFADAFAVGAIDGDGGLDNKYLSAKDVSGVALAAVKELQKKTDQIDELNKRVAQLEALIEKLLSEKQ